jgi:hypothetical protein
LGAQSAHPSSELSRTWPASTATDAARRGRYGRKGISTESREYASTPTGKVLADIAGHIDTIVAARTRAVDTTAS